ncbi:MAG TPA: SRPBCC domain-containing protein [Burkholderiales bacterium]|nr:SRPBCC domain-containing protein [Burkholderiales bacterium]
MAAKSNLAVRDEPLVVERTFDAPVALVWKALTDKEDIKQWSFELREFAPVVGFEFQFDVEHEGVRYCHRCKVTEAIPNRRLAYTWRYEGHAGDSLVSFDLFAEGSKTRVKLTHEGLETFPKLPAFAKANFAAGWTEIVGTSLKNFVEGKRAGEMILTRVFDAPRELVFRAWSDRAHLTKWWGPKGFTLPGCEMDFRTGGAYRFVMRGPDGNDNPFHGVYREIVRNERIVFTAILDKLPGHELLTTVTFADEGGKTKLTVRQTTPPGEAGRGQNQGWSETLERLADHLTKDMEHGRKK